MRDDRREHGGLGQFGERFAQDPPKGFVLLVQGLRCPSGSAYQSR